MPEPAVMSPPDLFPAADLPLNDPQHATRRCVPRLLHCLLSPADGGAGVAAIIADCSALGLRLMASRRLEPGSAAAVRLPGAGAGRPELEFAVRVAHCADQGTGWFAVGVEFLPPLTDEQARLLLARVNAGPA